jgi:transcriptional regulator with XRE-family HTH domain
MSVELMRDRFAQNLLTLRKKAGLSQEALAEASGLHRTEISLLERRKRSPRVETLVVLARALGFSLTAELFKGIH